MLVIGGGTLAFIAYRAAQPHTVSVAPGIPSLIFFDDKTELSGSGGALISAIAQSAASALPASEVRVLYLAMATSTNSGTTTIPGTGGDLIQALALPAPDILLRNIAPPSTVGIVNAQGETRVFFILRVTSYDATFRGMLSWEPSIAHDLAALYPAYPAQAAAIAASTTATSSAPATATGAPALAPTSVSAAPQFIDETVDNHDVRALKDSAGRSILLYGYYDEQTLIIARDEASFEEIIGRLGATVKQGS